jgi:hypothetical protein
LETGDSLHFFSVRPEVDDTLSYFRDTSGQLSEYAPALREGVASGLIDTLHTWGNFSQKGGFLREHAQRASEELDKHGLKIPCWTNHGDIHNFQNLGRNDSLGDVPRTASVRGDSSQVLEYHFDLTLKAGVRYVWIKELTPIPGQERSLEPADWLEEGSALGRNALKDILKRFRGSTDLQTPHLANRLIKPFTFRDGTVAYEMIRFGSFQQDGSDHLPDVLSAKNVRRLVENRGAALLYTHLGKGRPSPEKPFTVESYAVLERLAQRQRDGDLWITTPSRLCRYVELRRRLKLRATSGDAGINVNGWFESLGDLSDPDVSGLTFYLNPPQQCRLHLEDEEIPLNENPVDEGGRVSYSVTLQPVPYCWQ